MYKASTFNVQEVARLKAGSNYFAWLSAVPNGDLEGKLTFNNNTRQIDGSGYHDHNWGNTPLQKLFKRDFAGEFIKKFKKIKLIDYGFIYHRDKLPQDDVTWFLLQKK